MDCPFCSEEISDSAVKCKHCGEFLDEPEPQSSGGASVVVILVVIFGALCVFVAIIAAIAIPNLIEARKNGNETAAIGALKTISTSQMLFREADKDGNQILDYGNLKQLGQANLIDFVLASGTKQGYVFTTQASSADPEFIFWATADPVAPGKTGDRHFAINQEGVIFYSPNGPILIGDDGVMPQGLSPVGW